MSGVFGFVVAGGRGERLALGRPKALAELGGRTLLQRAIERLEPLCDELLVVAPETIALPVPAERLVADAGRGPLVALAAAFSARPFARALVLGVDLPLVPRALLRALEREAGDGAVMARAGGRAQPLVSAWAPAAAAALVTRAATGERALVPAAIAAGVRALDVETLGFPDDVLLNVNTLADLDRAAAWFAADASR